MRIDMIDACQMFVNKNILLSMGKLKSCHRDLVCSKFGKRRTDLSMWDMFFGPRPGLEHLSSVLRVFGEEPIWQDLPNTQRSYTCKRCLAY